MNRQLTYKAVCFILAMLFLPISGGQAAAPGQRAFYMGFVTFPATPDNQGLDRAYEIIRDHGDIVSIPFKDGVPWDEALLSSNYLTYSSNLQTAWAREMSRINQFVPTHKRMVLIHPVGPNYLGLANRWGDSTEMPLLAPWSGYEFNHPDVKTAFLNYAIAAIEYFQPAYFAIGIESNILLARRPDRWEAYKELNKYVYQELKIRYPNLVVFTTINYEHLLGLGSWSADLREAVKDSYPNVLESEARFILADSDMLVIATYPYMIQGNVPDKDYFCVAKSMAREMRKKLAIEQTGYQTRNVVTTVPEIGQITMFGSEDVQVAFLNGILEDAVKYDYEFVINFISQDYGTIYGSNFEMMTWSYTGLFNVDGTAKPVVPVWDAYLNMQVVTP